jgi:DNA-binding CsgD family transcriptional regulator
MSEQAIRASLSRREVDVVALVLAGLPNKQIARELGIDETTVKTHLHRVFEKCGARDRTQLTARLYQFGGWWDGMEWSTLPCLAQREAPPPGTPAARLLPLDEQLAAGLQLLILPGTRIYTTAIYRSQKMGFSELAVMLNVDGRAQPINWFVGFLLGLEDGDNGGLLVPVAEDPDRYIVEKLAYALHGDESTLKSVPVGAGVSE